MKRVFVAALCLLAMSQLSFAQTQAAATDPAVIHAPIEYPPAAVNAGEQGTVLVKVEVNTDGRAVGATIDKSSGHADLDEAALRSISQWSFSPATKNGKPEAQWIIMPVAFQLKEDPSDGLDLFQNLLAALSVLLGALGALFWVAGFIWSIVLAKRKSIVWLSGMVALWAVVYPLFVATNWSLTWRNLICVGLGIALMGLSLYLLPSQMVPI